MARFLALSIAILVAGCAAPQDGSGGAPAGADEAPGPDEAHPWVRTFEVTVPSTTQEATEEAVHNCVEFWLDEPARIGNFSVHARWSPASAAHQELTLLLLGGVENLGEERTGPSPIEFGWPGVVVGPRPEGEGESAGLIAALYLPEGRVAASPQSVALSVGMDPPEAMDVHVEPTTCHDAPPAP